MAKRTRIIDIPVFTAQGKRFNIDFCHEGGGGYRIFITPYASNVDPEGSQTALQLTGAGSQPGMAHHRLDRSARTSKAKTEQFRPIAIAKIAEMVKAMLAAYGLEVDDLSLLAQVEQAAEVSA